MAERRLRGVAASPGLVLGRFRRLNAVHLGDGQDRGPQDLRAAIQRARCELAELLSTLGEDEAEILQAQSAFLEDDELARPAYEAIAEGADAGMAWREALDAEIATYRAADDEYFRARAADFEDLRDRVLAALHGHSASGADIGPGTIVVAEDLGPSQFLAGRWASGSAIALASGSPNSHLAMLARGRRIAMIVGLGDEILTAEGEGLADGFTGEVVCEPGRASAEAARIWRKKDEAIRREAEAHAGKPARTRDGTPIAVEFTLAGPADLDGLDPDRCDGIGLVRTELFLDRLDRLVDEELQYTAYCRILDWARGRPVTIRTVDAGGDKPIPGYTPEHERNPFLGMRGIRLSLMRPEILRIQLRALARAAARGNLRVMLPMVSQPGELDIVRDALQEVVADLARAGVPHALPPLGIMIEVPAVAIMPERFDADFFSIGSNDLVQYAFAADRGNAACAALARIDDPVTLRLLGNVAAHGSAAGKAVGLCGDAGSDPALVPVLLKSGLRTLSVQPRLAGAVKAAIARVDLSEDDG